MSKVKAVSTSLRTKSNSDILADQLIAGAKDAGREVEHISLKGKKIGFCVGCLSCQSSQQCILRDDSIEIAEKVKNADTLVFVTTSSCMMSLNSLAILSIVYPSFNLHINLGRTIIESPCCDLRTYNL